jgi:hypothetical protein
MPEALKYYNGDKGNEAGNNSNTGGGTENKGNSKVVKIGS